MKQIFQYSCFFLLLIFLACNTKESHSSKAISVDPDRAVKANLSEHFESIDYILLDYPDSLPIVNAYSMHFTDENILVESRETAAIFIFDRSGKLQNVIRNYGEGPGEFVFIDEFYVEDDRIIVYGRPWKQLAFDFDGNLLEEVKLPLRFNRHFRGENFSLYHYQYGEGEDKWTFQRVAGDEVHGYLPLKEGHDTFIRRGAPWGFSCDPSRKQLYFVEPNTYNIQIFDENGYWKDSITFDFGRYAFDSKKRLDLAQDHQQRRSYLDENPKVDNLTTFNGFKNFLMLTFNLPGQGNHAVFLNDEQQITSLVKEWENDFDGMKVYNFHWAFTEDQVIYQLNSRRFYQDYAETFNGKQVEVKPGNVHGFVEKNRDKLKDEKVVLVALKVK